jgi:hypothetical protein
MTHYRTGNRNGRNLYRVDPDAERHIGCMFTEDDGFRVATALNLTEHRDPVFPHAVRSASPSGTRGPAWHYRQAEDYLDAARQHLEAAGTEADSYGDRAERRCRTLTALALTHAQLATAPAPALGGPIDEEPMRA